MWQICKKELKQFFSSLAGFLAVGVFLLVMGLVLFVLPNTKYIDFNIFDYGFASLDKYFSLTPWVLMLLTPSICMRLFADEYKQGTFEILITKPITIFKIILGKWLGGFLVLILALLPTLLYMFCVKSLAFNNDIDTGAILGSYLGLLLLAGCFSAISLWASSFTTNYIVSFLLGVLFNFLVFVGFNVISKLGIWNYDLSATIENIGMETHYTSISQGLIALKDVLYFIVLIALFLWFTYYVINKKVSISQLKNSKIAVVASTALAILVISIVKNIHLGADLTNSKRFSLTKGSKAFLSKNEKAIEVKILYNGSMPAEFKRLKESLTYFLKDCKQRSNANFEFNYVDVEEASSDSLAKKYINFAVKNGVKPISLKIEKGDEGSQIATVIPAAIVISGNRAVVVDLFKDAFETSQKNQTISKQEGIGKAEALLEYKFSQAFYKVTLKADATVAISSFSKNPIDAKSANLIAIADNYYLNKAFIDLNIINTIPNNINTLIINNPLETFNDKAKINIDQFVMRGGNLIIGYNSLYASMDSLMNTKNGVAAFPLNAGLDDLLFNYGIRVNPDIVQAKFSDSIPLQTDEVNGNPQFSLFAFSYFPILQGNQNHPITNGIKYVNSEFGSSIDTMPNKNTTKTILLNTIGASRKVGSPVMINFDEGNLDVILDKLNTQNVPMGVLVEGNFKSIFALRETKALNDSLIAWTGNPLIKESKSPSKIIVLADGQILENAVTENPEKKTMMPVPMGLNRFTDAQFDNADFFDNCLLYFIGTEDGLAMKESRNKNFKVNFFDPKKLIDENKVGEAFNFSSKGVWQFICVLLPTLMVGICMLIHNFLRRKKYTQTLL